MDVPKPRAVPIDGKYEVREGTPSPPIRPRIRSVSDIVHLSEVPSMFLKWKYLRNIQDEPCRNRGER